MAEAPSVPFPMLFAPPRPPLRLLGLREVVIGRAPSCDLPVDSARASRRHAAVRRRGDRFCVQDLGSKNGTFVNGQRVDGDHTLEPGDRIGIGEAVVTFCQVEGALAEAASHGGADETMVMSPIFGPRAGLVGSFEQIPAFAVLQMLELGGQSGLLAVEDGACPGRLWIERGRPVHAEAAERRGFDAAIALTQAASGRFRFEPGAAAPERTIEVSLTHVLLEASRLSDEGGAGEE
jgi:pSer/pThr/pTyr-binding forkhead associated (FHA) protein